MDYIPESPAVWTDAVDEQHAAVKKHFSLPLAAYIGSHLNCGCGFRNFMFQQGGWPGDWLVEQEGYEPEEGTQKNHQELANYLRRNFGGEGVELYGCWDGEEGEQGEGVESIALEKILDPKFHFKSRVVYQASC